MAAHTWPCGRASAVWLATGLIALCPAIQRAAAQECDLAKLLASDNANGDAFGGGVGITDFLDLLAVWGTDPGGPPDFDGDGVVGITDFLALLSNWGPCP